MTNNTTNSIITLEEIKSAIANASAGAVVPVSNNLTDVLEEANICLAFSDNLSIWDYLEKLKDKKEVHILNAFSISMIDDEGGATVEFTPLAKDDVKSIIDNDDAVIVSHIGHTATASIIGAELGINNLYAFRDNYKLLPKNNTIVAQYIGPRLPEGATLKYFNVVLK